MDLLFFTLLLGLALGHFAFIFNQTDFVFEYGSRLGLSKILRLKEYLVWKENNNMDHGYPMFLRETYPNFWTTLMGCPFCLVTFLSMLFSLITLSYLFPFVGLAAGGIASFVYLKLNSLYQKNSS